MTETLPLADHTGDRGVALRWTGVRGDEGSVWDGPGTSLPPASGESTRPTSATGAVDGVSVPTSASSGAETTLLASVAGLAATLFMMSLPALSGATTADGLVSRALPLLTLRAAPDASFAFRRRRPIAE